MYALLWSWSFTGLFLSSILANGVMGSDEMFNSFNGTYVFHRQDDNDDDADHVLVVGLTLVQAATADGAGKYLFPF